MVERLSCRLLSLSLCGMHGVMGTIHRPSLLHNVKACL